MRNLWSNLKFCEFRLGFAAPDLWQLGSLSPKGVKHKVAKASLGKLKFGDPWGSGSSQSYQGSKEISHPRPSLFWWRTARRTAF